MSAVSSPGAIVAGRAALILGVDDRTNQGLATVQNRLRSFAFLVRNIGLSITGAISFRALADPLREFAKAEQILGRLDAVFGNLSGAALKFAQDLGKSINESKFEVIDAVSQFQAVFQGFGFDQSSSFGLSKFFAEAAFDLKAFDDTLTNTQEAIDTLQSGIAGEVRPVRRAFGADVGLEARNQITESLRAAQAIQDGTLQLSSIKVNIDQLKESFKGLSEQQQFVVARSLLMADALRRAGVSGQAIREVNTLESRYRGLASAYRDARIELGRTLATGGGGIIVFLTESLKDIEALIRRHPVLTNVIAATTLSVGGFAFSMVGLSIAINAAIFALSPFSIAIRSIFSSVGLAVGSLKTLASALVSLSSIGIHRLVFSPMVLAVKTLNGLLITLGSNLFKAGSIGRVSASVIYSSFKALSGPLQAIGSLSVYVFGIWQRVASSSINTGIAINALNRAYIKFFASIATMLPGIIGNLALLAGAATAGFLLYRGMGVLAETLQLVASNAAEAGKAILSGIVQGLQTTLTLTARVSVGLVTAFNTLKSSLSSVSGSLFGDFKASFESISSAVQSGNIKSAFAVIVSTGKLAFAELKIAFQDVYYTAGPQIRSALLDAAKEFKIAMLTIVDGIARLLGSILSPIINAIDQVVVNIQKGARVAEAVNKGLADNIGDVLTGNYAGAVLTARNRINGVNFDDIDKARAQRIGLFEDLQNGTLGGSKAFEETMRGAGIIFSEAAKSIRAQVEEEFAAARAGNIVGQVPADVRKQQLLDRIRAKSDLDALRKETNEAAKANANARDAAAAAKLDEEFQSNFKSVLKGLASAAVDQVRTIGTFGGRDTERQFLGNTELQRLLDIARDQLKVERDMLKEQQKLAKNKVVFQ